MRYSYLIPLSLLALIGLGGKTAHAQIWQLQHHESISGNHFGTAVAVDGDHIVVGASGDPHCGENSGAAFLYERDEYGTFQPAGRLVPRECEPGAFFGRLVALSGDHAAVAAGGETVHLQANNAVHVFERGSDGSWSEVTVLRPPADSDRSLVFGSAIALQDGLMAVASAGDTSRRQYHGAVHVYQRDDEGWRRAAELRPRRGTSGGVFGSDVAISGDVVAVSASPYAARGAGSVFVFERGLNDSWTLETVLDGLTGFRIPVALAGPLLAVGEPSAGPERSGQVAIFTRRRTGGWVRTATLSSHVPYRHGSFGTVVAAYFGDDGPRLLAAGYTEQLGRGENIDRVVHVFDYDAAEGWRQRQVLDLGHWAFAMALGLSERTVVAGQPLEDEPGAAFVIRLLP